MLKAQPNGDCCTLLTHYLDCNGTARTTTKVVMLMLEPMLIKILMLMLTMEE